MAELAVVRRYARALFDTARKTNMVDQVEQDLKTLDGILRTVPRLQRVLHAPTIPASQKRQMIDTAFASKVGELTLRFLRVTVQHRRETVLSQIYPEFLRLANEARNVLPVEVTAAVPM